MKIEELRQALTFHYQSEGHSLLGTDGSFPYSNKDIELVCGSLVHIRNGTLQVVHLTVKEYIQSFPEPDNSSPLIEAQSASSRLAIVCLNFLGSNCTRASTNSAIIDSEKSNINLEQLYTNAPFIEYAVTFWMFHLTCSKAQDSVGVSKQFCKTFNSASTFYWLETYLALHSSNLPDLFIFLDAVRNWVIRLEENCLPVDNSNFSFIIDWCGAMEQVLQEYGQTLVLRPFEIHHLNVGFAFSTGKLAEMYEKFGSINAREVSSRFDIHDHLRGPIREVPTHRRLQGDVGVFKEGIDLFLFDSRRNVYIWSPLVKNSNEIALFVQSATNGIRLRPVKWQRDSEEASTVCMVRTSAYDLSRDGKFLLIIVRLSDGLDLTLVWQIEDYLDFSIALQAAPWAYLKFKCVSNPRRCPWIDKLSIAFRSDGGFCTPAGLVDSALKNLSPTSADDIGVLLDPEKDKALYCGNGEFLFIAKLKFSVHAGVIEKVAWPDMQTTVEFDLLNMAGLVSGTSSDAVRGPVDHINVEAISPSGRYLIFRYHFFHRLSTGRSILLDTLSGNVVDMERNSDHGYPIHFFFDGESEINMFFWADDGELEVINYIGLSSSAFPKSRQAFSGSKGSRLSYIGRTSDDHKVAIMITESGVIRCKKFGDKIVEPLDEIEMINDDSNENVESRHFLSQNGARLALLEFRRDIFFLQVFDIINTGERLRHLEFDTRSFTLSYTMSPDLSILVVGTKVYNIGTPDDQIAVRPFELTNISWEGYRRCEVSSSNTFMVFFPSINRPQLDIFLLNIDGTSWNHVQASLPKNMAEFSAQLHPSRPLMAILYQLDSKLPTLEDISEISKDDRQTDSQVPPAHHVAIIELETGRVKPVGILENMKSVLVQRLESNHVITFNSVKSLTFRQSFYKKEISTIKNCFLARRNIIF